MVLKRVEQIYPEYPEDFKAKEEAITTLDELIAEQQAGSGRCQVGCRLGADTDGEYMTGDLHGAEGFCKSPLSGSTPAPVSTFPPWIDKLPGGTFTAVYNRWNLHDILKGLEAALNTLPQGHDAVFWGRELRRYAVLSETEKVNALRDKLIEVSKENARLKRQKPD